MWSAHPAPQMLPETIKGLFVIFTNRPMTSNNTLWAILGSNQ